MKKEYLTILTNIIGGVESGGQTWSRTLVTAIAWIAGVILMLIAVLAIAAVFAPLLGFAA